jgi:hypothetical protein
MNFEKKATEHRLLFCLLKDNRGKIAKKTPVFLSLETIFK